MRERAVMTSWSTGGRGGAADGRLCLPGMVREYGDVRHLDRAVIRGYRAGAAAFVVPTNAGHEGPFMAATIPENFQDLLTSKITFAHLGTVMKNGTPQVTPIWFSCDGKQILLNSAKGRVKDAYSV